MTAIRSTISFRLSSSTALVAVAILTSFALAVVSRVAGGGVVAYLSVAALGVVVGLHRWEWSIYALLTYIPVSGVLIILLYPDNTPAVVAKDVFFLYPAYLGFAVWALRTRTRIAFRAAPVALLAGFSVLVVVQTFNPDVPNLLTGIIGTKVWISYIPLLFIGYHLISTKAQLERVLKVMALTALVPAVIGIVEAAALAAGNFDAVYRFYGDAAYAVTQRFAEAQGGGGLTLRRVPSTFSFVTQYYAFTISMIAVTYAYWRLRRVSGRSTRKEPWIWGTLIVASLLSGTRGAFLFVPVLIVLLLVLDKRGIRLSKLALPVIAYWIAVVAVLGTSAGIVLANSVNTGLQELSGTFIDGLLHEIPSSIAGSGSGVNTIAAASALEGVDTEALGRGNESWYIKAGIELGIVGFVLAGALMYRMLRLGTTMRARVTDPSLRPVAAAFLAFLIWNAIYGVKGQYMDLDPINVYFWLFAGLLCKLPHLASDGASSK